jgi:ABC-2 type transport system ATP-binding protein
VGDLARHLGIPADLVCEVRPGDYLVSVAATPSLLARVTSWLAEHDALVSELRAGRRSLEDVFLRLTSEGRS